MALAEARRNVNKRMVQFGWWDEYVRIREQLKSEGVPATEAWKQAAEQIDELYGNDNSSVEQSPSTENPKAGPIVQVVTLADFGSEKLYSNPLESVKFVSTYLNITDVTPDMAPSSEAWNLLVNTRRSQVRQDDFWDKQFTRTFPTKATIDRDDECSDDGRTIRLYDRIEQSHRDAVLSSGS